MHQFNLSDNLLRNDRVVATVDFVHKAYYGMKDKSGEDYADHSYRVAERAATFARNDQEEVSLYVVGLGHDLIEDTTTTTPILRCLGFTKIEIEAILAMTNKVNGGERIYEDYDHFIDAAINNGFLSTAGKFSDVTDNLTRKKHKGFKYGQKLAALEKLTRAMRPYFVN